MRATLTLIRRELTAYFWSPVAYVVLGVFLLGLGLLFNFTMDLLAARGPKGVEFPMQGLLGNVGFWLIFWVIPPLLTMRLFAEERSTGTLEMLMTAPVRDTQVVLSKFIACFLFYVMIWLPTVLYLWVLLDMRTGDSTSSLPFGIAFGVDPWPAVTSYIGLLLAGAMFLSIGLWVSSLVKSQMVAAMLALAINLVFILGGLLILGGFLAPPSDAGELSYRVINFISVPLHFSRDFCRGIIDTRHVVLYVSVTIACLFLTVKALESRRWR
jgi:ABC-2 type transport system permease protein